MDVGHPRKRTVGANRAPGCLRCASYATAPIPRPGVLVFVVRTMTGWPSFVAMLALCFMVVWIIRWTGEDQ